MTKRSIGFLTALGLGAIIATGTANAQNSGNKGVWDVHHKNTTQAPATQQRQPGVLDHGRTQPTRPVAVGARPTNQPPGWEHGRKTGWGDCDVPPGQAKKAGCGPAFRHNRRRVQRRDHRWEERREHQRRDAHRATERRHERMERRHERSEMERRGTERRHERIEVAKRGRR